MGLKLVTYIMDCELKNADKRMYLTGMPA
jgi:hypothetical protein